jgi:hypothetical protein
MTDEQTRREDYNAPQVPGAEPAKAGSEDQTDSRSLRRIGGVTLAENRASERLPIACEPHEYRSGEGLPTRSFCQAQYAYLSRTL